MNHSDHACFHGFSFLYGESNAAHAAKTSVVDGSRLVELQAKWKQMLTPSVALYCLTNLAGRAQENEAEKRVILDRHVGCTSHLALLSHGCIRVSIVASLSAVFQQGLAPALVSILSNGT